MAFDKKINLALSNQTPYNLAFKENGLKWGRIIHRADEIKSQGDATLVVSNKNNTSIIEGTLTYSVECPVKQVELVFHVSVSEGKPFVFKAELTIEGRHVDHVYVAQNERLQINKQEDNNPDTWENEYSEEITLVRLYHK